MNVSRAGRKVSRQEKKLIAGGVLTPPLKQRTRSFSWPKPPGNISDKIMEQVLRDEREGR